ncbi:MAG TPA: PEP-CTERM sorting domain-containing protein [Fimbriimonadaceae bacterium]|nr:hypothetical protein [Armatimonadota bacterium]HRD32304.1 PEP-CTERM sorting domain-containing protein [Fimbriimonadaceae bacterium]HRE93901.1 PEP-CTERM sorting domain-containing protein [Fimbriimonadaceae bacterium]HRI72964.1 PEP-CTERM sorting domain-containing protein [Fimbriimonadaceae bacterium]
MKLALIGLGLAAAPLSSAQVFFNTFGSGDTYNRFSGMAVSGRSSLLGSEISQGIQFQAAHTGAVSQLVMAIGHSFGQPVVNLRLFNDNSNTMGTSVGGFYATGVNPSSFGRGTEVITRDVSAVGWSLVAGQKYWLFASSGSDSWLTWNFSDDGKFYQRFTITNGSAPNYYPSNGMAVRLEAVPEPASMIALGAGLLAVARRRRRA